jgi:hypothetical protein
LGFPLSSALCCGIRWYVRPTRPDQTLRSIISIILEIWLTTMDSHETMPP